MRAYTPIGLLALGLVAASAPTPTSPVSFSLLPSLLPAPSPPSPRSERVQINDNQISAGGLRDGVLTIRLEARIGTWHPDGDDAPGAEIPVFAEEGKPAQIPGPLIRVPAGTEVRASLRNSLPKDTLIVAGLSARPIGTASADTVLPGAIRELRFRLETPGTYYYWGTTMGRPFNRRSREDAQLSGALVVDPPGAAVRDRILMIGMWADTVGSETTTREGDRLLFVVNGRSWPHTERFSHQVGDTVRWRVLNTSADVHPMHLHGFYFQVESRGNGQRDSVYAASHRELVNTERMLGGATMLMSWVPERPGNWLFHCHIPDHFGPRGSLGERLPGRAVPGSHANHALEGMNGLVVGIRVRSADSAATSVASEVAGRRIRLLVRPNEGTSEASPFYGFALHESGTEPPPDSGHRIGPPIVLSRGEPVSIVVVNRTPEPTAVHWHGIELESYFDGVAGWSGSEGRIAPSIAPADSFEARFTPPRAGTFIYHTHVDELRQQRAGLAGPLIVLEPGARHDPATDIIVLITSPGDSMARRAVLLNGSLSPPPLELQGGSRYRMRFINITVGRPAMRMELRRDTTLVSWRRVAKDGAALDETQSLVPARQPISIGETFDLELALLEPGELRLEARTAGGSLLGWIPVRVK